MRIDINSQFSVPPQEDVPFAVHNKAVEHQSASQLAQVKLLQKQAAQRKRVADQFDERLRSLLGAKLHKTYTDYLAEQDAFAAKRLGRAKDQDSLLEARKKLEAEGAESARDFIGKHNIDPNKIQALVDRMIRDFGRTHQAAPSKAIQPPEDKRAATGKKIGGPYTVFRPPFAGWSWYYTHNLHGYEFRPTLYLDSGIGLIGNDNSLNAPRNGGGLYGETTYNAAIAFWYLMPATGLVQATVELEVVRNFYNSNMRWEYIFPWSFPSGSVNSDIYVTFKADGVRPGAWQSEYANSISQEYPRAPATGGFYYTLGARYNFYFTDDAAHAAGTWVLIQVGTLTTNRCRTNQIFAASDVSSQWLVRSVQVRSTG